MSCITTGLKILTSRSCELASITEMDVDLREKDADFVKVVRNFLKNLKLVHSILPLPQWICCSKEEIIGIGSTCDGGVPAFGCVNYLICRNTSSKERRSKICCSKSKISKRSVPANEALARMLQADTTKSVAKVLSRRIEIVNKEVEIYLMGDSSCVAALFSPTITIKNILLRNIVVTVKQRIREILDMIPLAKVQMCWIPG